MFAVEVFKHCLTSQKTRLACCFIPAQGPSNSDLSMTHSGNCSEFLSRRRPAQLASLPTVLLILRIKKKKVSLYFWQLNLDFITMIDL